MGNKASPSKPPPPKPPKRDKLDTIIDLERDQSYMNNRLLTRQNSIMERENRILEDGLRGVNQDRSLNNRKSTCELNRCEKDMRDYDEKKNEENKQQQQKGLSLLSENLAQITTLIKKTKSEVEQLEDELKKTIQAKEDFDKKNKYYTNK